MAVNDHLCIHPNQLHMLIGVFRAHECMIGRSRERGDAGSTKILLLTDVEAAERNMG
jgi:hypothetical protein